MSEPHPEHIVVIGFGPVGARFVDELEPALTAGHATLTVVGAETGDPYNRVLVAEHAVGHIAAQAMSLGGSDRAVAAGARILTGATASSISRTRKFVSVEHADGGAEDIAYDRLVFATGARANIPTLQGIDTGRRAYLRPVPGEGKLDAAGGPLPSGVTALRDLVDAKTVFDAVASGRRIIVLGAGVLGMEIALAAASAGAEVCVVYHGEHPMERNLDRGSAMVLAREARRAGVAMVDHSRAESVLLRLDPDGIERFTTLVCADGKQISADLLVLSCGVSARSELARLAGLDVAAGILVDPGLRSWSDPAVYAIGDCAQLGSKPQLGDVVTAPTGAPSGLIGPGWRQADWLAATFVRELGHTDGGVAAASGLLAPERPPLVMLKAEGIDIVAAGDLSVDPWDDHNHTPSDCSPVEVAQWADPEHGRYVKMVTRDGVLVAFACAGMPRTGAELTLLFERGSELPADRSVLLRFDGPDYDASAAVDRFELSATVCWCNGVNVASVGEAAAAGDGTLACVSSATRAGTGCGGCKGRIAEVIEWFGRAEIAPSDEFTA